MPHFSCQGTLTSKLQLTIDKLTIDKLWVIFVCVFVIDKVTKKAVHLLDFGWPGVLDLLPSPTDNDARFASVTETHVFLDKDKDSTLCRRCVHLLPVTVQICSIFSPFGAVVRQIISWAADRLRLPFL